MFRTIHAFWLVFPIAAATGLLLRLAFPEGIPLIYWGMALAAGPLVIVVLVFMGDAIARFWPPRRTADPAVSEGCASSPKTKRPPTPQQQGVCV